jgi:hypothetical protein
MRGHGRRSASPERDDGSSVAACDAADRLRVPPPTLRDVTHIGHPVAIVRGAPDVNGRLNGSVGRSHRRCAPVADASHTGDPARCGGRSSFAVFTERVKAR